MSQRRPARIPALAALAAVAFLLAGCSHQGDLDEGGSAAHPLPLSWTWDESPVVLPEGLAEAAIAQDGPEVYLVGGFGEVPVAGAFVGGSTRVAYVNLDSNLSAHLVPDYPLPVHHAAAAVHGDHLYVFGGYVSGALLPGTFVAGAGPSGWPRTGLAFRLDLTLHMPDARWEPIPSLPEPRAAGGAAVVGSRILIAGGFGPDDGYLTDVLAYDPANGTYDAAAQLPVARDHLSVVGDGGRLHVAAGRALGGGAWDDLEAFHTLEADGTWTSQPDVPLGRGGQAAAFGAGHLAVVGGERAEGSFTVYDAAHAFDVANGTWVELPAMPEPRHGGALVWWDGAFTHLGGAGESDLLATSLRLVPTRGVGQDA